MFFEDLLTLWPEHFALQILFIILMSFILEDPTTLFVGSLISLGQMSFQNGFIALSLGIFLGDVLLYFMGYAAAKGFLKSNSRIRASVLPYSVLIFARFIPGMRLVTYTGAGYLKKNFTAFLLIVCLGSLVWCYALLSLSKEGFNYVFEHFPGSSFLWVLLAMLLFWLIERIVARIFCKSHNGTSIRRS